MSQKDKSKSVSQPFQSPQQAEIERMLMQTYSPYIGAGTLGGLSDLERTAMGMLKSADIWGPMTGAATGLLTGTMGAQPITGEEASKAFEGAVVNPRIKSWERYEKPAIKEEYAGPGYWAGERARAVTKGGQDVGDWLGTERANWMWDVGQANRGIEEAKAGRALSALGTTPGALGQWTGTLFGTGQAARQILNQITDPEVMGVLQFLLGMNKGQVSRGTSTPSEFQRAKNWAGSIGGVFQGLGF